MSIKRRNKLINLLLFVVLVLLPWIAIIAYMQLYAAPRYVSESNVVIKQISDQGGSSTGISALLGVNTTNRDDAVYLTEYIMSNDMIAKLDERFDFRKNFRLDGRDFVNEIAEDATQEELNKYFKKRVSISLDETSSILTLSTQGFTPEFALQLNQAILSESEKFVNDISKQVAAEQLAFVTTQVSDAENRLNLAKQKLLDYQNNNEIIDPKANVEMVNSVIATLQGQLSSLRTEERQLLSYLNPEAPQVVSLRSQITSIEKQIKEEQAKLTSPKDAKLNAKTAEFEAIKADVDFANELYKLALTSLENSRIEAIRKMKNLIVISSPHKAEEAKYPRTAYVIGTSLALLLILYGFVVLILAIIRDHGK
ncbi:capsule biosynthesis protein [Moraxella pluranimalium]|uniref:Capsule biosynthesis protein n=1 Tax=Moraxella pluranimalium TaxID=470453 RepID=A0A1T0CPM4_9GAMM|nr:capsule biosynthesis protein [Moraxella pluranimalium]OOS24288.1 capsule biosynthesis protein [Moraxella pluranimalium]